MIEDNVSGASEHSAEEREELSAEYTFVFCYHTPEYGKEIAQAVESCDTIAIEYGGLASADERQRWNGMLTHYVSSATSQEEKSKIEDEVYKSSVGPFLFSILDHLKDSDKNIVLIDMDQDNDNYATAFDDNFTANHNLSDAMTGGQTSTEVIKDATKEYLGVASRAYLKRDVLMAQQLYELGKKPKKIGAVMGANHAPVQERFSGVAETKSVAIGPEVIYDYFAQAIFRAETDGVEAVSDSLLSRVVLEEIIHARKIDLGNASTFELVESFTDEQVTHLLSQIDEINKKYPSGKIRLLNYVFAQDEITEMLQHEHPTIPATSKVKIKKRRR